MIVCAGTLWGIIGLFSRSLSEAGLNALQIAGARCLVTAIILFFFLLLTNRKYLKIKLRDSWIFIGTGVFSIALFNVFYFICISKSTLAIASILLYTSPCFIIILSYFFSGTAHYNKRNCYNSCFCRMHVCYRNYRRWK
ncbi:DMT family transporter [Tissierella sp. MSJ-40]|uniref:DMT family transporter n=1 Tax=Tissierella simiarum TaxID=2841534 RepID=A0ABS6EAZ1_9FIRM|nr:DMT family transporter [Tissierella simiarum]